MLRNYTSILGVLTVSLGVFLFIKSMNTSTRVEERLQRKLPCLAELKQCRVSSISPRSDIRYVDIVYLKLQQAPLPR